MATSKWKRWGKRLGITVGILFVFYVIIGFGGVPLIIRHLVLAKLNEQVAGHGEVEAIRFNPFTWQLKLEQFAGYTPDGAEAMRFREFRVNIQPTSYFSDEWVVLEIYLDEPFMNLIIDENGKINIASSLGRLQDEVSEIQAKQEAAAAKPDAEPFVIPAVRIDSLQVVNAGMRAQIDSFGQPFLREVKNLSFVMEGIRTDATHNNPYSFRLETGQGEQIAVTGNLKLDPLSSQGSFRIDQLHLKDFLVFAGDQVGFEMGGGVLDFSIDYNFMPLGTNPQLGLENGHVELQDMSLVAKGETEPFETITNLEIQGLGLDVLQDKIHLDSFTLDGAMLRVVRGKDGLLNLIRYITPPERQAEIANAAQREANAEQTAAREIRLGVVSADQDLGVALTSAWLQVQELVSLQWELAASSVNISNVDLIWQDEFLTRPAELRWTKIALTATDLTNGEAPFPFDLSLFMNDSGQLATQGTFTPTPAASAFTFTVTDLPLSPMAPYLDNLAPVRLTAGALSAYGKAEIAFPETGLPVLSAEVDAQLNNFALGWAEPATPLLAWKNLALSGGVIGTQPLSAVAGQVSLTEPVIYVERLADGQLRIPQPTTKDAPDSSPSTTSTEPASPTEPFSVEIDEFVMTNGVVHIKDDYVSPASAFAVSAINLRAAPIAMPNIQPMTLALDFKLSDGPSGSVKIDGAMDPLQPFEATEMRITTNAVTLPPFAAYAIPVIGQPPIQGKLTATLGYTVSTGNIVGNNQIKLANMRFGERPEGIDAPNIPLEIGRQILEDSSGVMNIDIPVEGDINDPDFTLIHMISYAIGNVIEKIVLSPFTALGIDLPGGKDGEPSYFSFAPGSSTLSPDMQALVEQLGQKMTDRPIMRISLTPSVDPTADSEALRAQKFDTLLANKMAEDSDDAEDATKTLYRALPPTEPKRPSASDLTLDQQQEAVRQSIEISTDDLTALGQARVTSVRIALLATPNLAAERIVAETETPYASDGPHVNLAVESDLAE